ncbi:MAG: hypothetical protein KDA86_18330 [Planctomycetaceae bacterium]|nr:hypothetical protein [Planctomycetaceae bacterium]
MRMFLSTLSLFRRSIPLLGTGLLAVSLVAPVGFADEPADQELQGIIPDFIPNGITEGDFSELNGNWAEWADETGTLVTNFYSSEDQSVIGRRATLNELKRRIETMKRALADPQYQAIHLRLADYYYRLAPRVAILEALLDTIQLDLPAATESHVHTSIGDVAKSGVALREHLKAIPAGEAWLPYLGLPDVIAAAQSDADLDRTLDLVEGIRLKLAERTAMSEVQRDFLSSEPFLAFEDALTRTMSFVAAQNPEGYREHIRELAANLMGAIEDYEEEPLSEYTRAIRLSYDDIRKVAPDGGARLTETMRRFYLNYNLRLMIDEKLAQSLFNESRFESGFINEMVSKARVTGCQWTNTDAWIDFKHSDNGLRFDLGLKGNIRAKTQGETHAATVYIAGQHGFRGSKEVLFDGDRFYMKPSNVSVFARNCPTGADTCLSGVPLLGPLTENIALKEARKQLPEANALTRRKIYQEAKPRFDREVAQNFTKAEYELETRVSGPLREQGLYPDVKQLTSTETDALVRSRTMEPGELGGSETFPLPLYPTHGMMVQIHESLLNNAAQRFELEGKTFTPEELQTYMQGKLERLTGRDVNLNNILPDPSENVGTEDSPKIISVTFHTEDAVRFNIEAGAIILYLRIGLNLEGREPIPPQSIRIELYPTLDAAGLHVKPGETIGVDAIEDVAPGDRVEQIARANVMRAKMQDIFEPSDLDTRYTFDLDTKRLTMDMTDLKVRGGWISFILTDGVTEHVGPVATAPAGEAIPVPPVAQPVPEATPEPVPVIHLENIDGTSQKAGSVASGPALAAPIRR